MERFKTVQREIENVRKKLDDAILNDFDEDICYRLSVELDELIEEYITIQEEERALV